MNRELSPSNEMNQFLEDVKEQIQYKPIRAEIEEEIRAHIEDRTMEYMDMGLEEKEASHRAVEQMGDGASIGIMMNDARHVKNYRPLLLMVLAAIFLGVLGNLVVYKVSFEYGITDGIASIIFNVYYFLWGLLILIAVYFKGYTFIVKHWKLIMNGFLVAGLLVSFFGIYGVQRLYYPLFSIYGHRISGHVMGFNLLLLSGPVLAITLYRWRGKGKSTIVINTILLLAIVLIQYKANRGFVLTSILILIVTVMITMFSLIHRGLIAGNKKQLYAWTVLGIIFVLLIYGTISFQDQKYNFRLFLHPEQQAGNHWQDDYNGVLIKELLSRAEVVGPIRLSAEELMNYGTGEWFFNEEEVAKITQYLHYDESNVTLTDILPQHYHNNYRFAFWILKYGWIPSVFLIAFVTGLYGLMFAVTYKIKNKLGHTLALACSVCLAVQMLLYLLGNFGYQYGAFSTLPFISEGLLSITTNMILVGIILSAYRYDNVLKEENYLKKVKKVVKE